MALLKRTPLKGMKIFHNKGTLNPLYNFLLKSEFSVFFLNHNPVINVNITVHLILLNTGRKFPVIFQSRKCYI